MNPEKRNYAATAAASSGAGRPIDTCPKPSPPSPVASQLNTLRAQLNSIEITVGQLIDGTRNVLSGDPRHEPVCQSPDQEAFSCPLEQDLADIGTRLDTLDSLLLRTLRNIQL